MRGFEGNTILINDTCNLMPESPVIKLKEIISDRTGVKMDQLLLIFSTKQLDESSNYKQLKEFGIGNNSTLTMVGRLKGGGMFLRLRIRLYNEEEVKITIDSDKTIEHLKRMIYLKNDILPKNLMCLMWAGVKLRDSRSLSYYNIKTDQTIVQSKSDLSCVPGLITSYEPDIISFEDAHEARAKMICGHVISTESMT